MPRPITNSETGSSDSVRECRVNDVSTNPFPGTRIEEPSGAMNPMSEMMTVVSHFLVCDQCRESSAPTSLIASISDGVRGCSCKAPHLGDDGTASWPERGDAECEACIVGDANRAVDAATDDMCRI